MSASSGALGMPVSRVAILAEIVVRHEDEAEPEGKHDAAAPGQDDAVENPVGHAEDDVHGAGRVVAEQIAAIHAPEKRNGPGRHDDEPFAAGVLEEFLLVVGRRGLRHASYGDSPSGGRMRTRPASTVMMAPRVSSSP